MDILKSKLFPRTFGILLTIGLLVSQVGCSNQESDIAKLVQIVELPKPPMQTAWRPDGKRFLADGFGSLAVWDTTTGKQIATPPIWVASDSVLYSPDGRLLVLSKSVRKPQKVNSVVVLDAEDHHVMREFTDMYPIEHGKAFSPDSRLLVVIADKKNGYSNVAAVLDVETGTVVAELKTLHTDPNAKGEDFIQRVVYSPDGATVVIAFVTNKIDVWSTKDWHLIKTFKAHKNWIRSMAISPDGKWLVTGNVSGGTGGHYDPATGITTEIKYDDPIKIWDTSTWQQVGVLPIHDKYTSSLAFLPDGKHLISANEDRILFWNMQTRKQVGVIKGGFKGGGALNFALSKDGEYLVVGGMGTLEVQVWKIVGQLN
jgi:WD40 repeat protein